MRKFIIGLIAAGALVPAAHAEPVYAVRPIDGYVCMKLNVTEAEVLNPRGTGIFILVAPRPDAAARHDRAGRGVRPRAPAPSWTDTWRCCN